MKTKACHRFEQWHTLAITTNTKVLVELKVTDGRYIYIRLSSKAGKPVIYPLTPTDAHRFAEALLACRKLTFLYTQAEGRE